MRISDTILRRPLAVAFGQAMQAGGLSSVDLAATRDASTVTLTASDGSVAPVPGADTSSAGVMTAADKAALDTLAGTHFDSRAEIAAASIPAPVSHVRTAGYGSAGDGGGALYRRVASEPTHNLKVQSADGAWWELVPENGAINVRQAGAKGDGVTNDGQAFLDCLAFASRSGGNYPTGFRIVVPASTGDYYLGATTLELKHRVVLEGQESGLPSGTASVLRWDAQVSGIIVHRYDTFGATRETTPTGGADGSIIRGLVLKGGGGDRGLVTDGTKGHGIWLRARAVIEDMVISGFAGNGIHVVATASTSSNAVIGNANNWVINRTRITGCHLSGIFVDGADVNAGLCLAADCSSNGRWGIWDSSFLGNTWIGCHAATNGLAGIAGNAANESSFVHYNGPENGNVDRRYAANAAASEADLAATVPGTDENVWIDSGGGGVHARIPTWQPGQPAGTYFAGGSYRTDNANARNVLVGCYQESGQGKAQVVKPTVLLGGFVGENFEGGGTGYADGEIVGAVSMKNATEGLQLNFNWTTNKLINADAPGDHSSGLNLLAWDGQDYLIGEHANLNARRPIRITSQLNTKTFGRPSAIGAGNVLFYKGIWIGNGGGRAKHFRGFDVKPAAGEWARGDVVWNYNPTVPGDAAGWRVTTGGAIGTDPVVVEEFFYAPDLPADRGATLRPHPTANRVEWRPAPKAGTATIADAASSVAVTFATPFADAGYAVAITTDGDERVWVTGKTATGFTLNRAGTVGARVVDWTATPLEDL